MKKIFFLTAALLLLAQFCFSSEQQKRFGEKISFTTQDGVEIVGLYSKPSSRARRTFVLLHGLGSNQEEWQAFAGSLIRQGYGFLSYDARGHGQSIHARNKSTIKYDQFGMQGSEWAKMISDLGYAVKFLRQQKGIDKIGIIGASLGANIALVYSSTNPDIRPLVLLSPGISYAGIETKDAIMAFAPEKGKKNRPIAIVSSPDDTYSYQSSILMYKQVTSNDRAVFLQGSDSNHGVNMLDKRLTKEIINFINKY
jgi:pimeloyl-ACP methyl ester carboxylesterase